MFVPLFPLIKEQSSDLMNYYCVPNLDNNIRELKELVTVVSWLACEFCEHEHTEQIPNMERTKVME